MHFFRRDHTTKAWDDPALASRFCDKTKSGHGSTVKDRIIFSHGVGSLIVAHAFYTGQCSQDSSTDWYSIGVRHTRRVATAAVPYSPALGSPGVCGATPLQAPWDGTVTADQASTICASYSGIMGAASAAIGICDGTSPSTAINALTTSPAYTSFSADFASLKSYASSNVDGYMCGWSSYGLHAGAGDELQAVDDVVTFGDVNDGFVGKNNCKNGATLSLGASANYAPAVNHLDLTCRNGNAFLDVFQIASPCTFYATVTA